MAAPSSQNLTVAAQRLFGSKRLLKLLTNIRIPESLAGSPHRMASVVGLARPIRRRSMGMLGPFGSEQKRRAGLPGEK